MANNFGTGNVTVYVDGQTITLPLTARGGREEDFLREDKVWEYPGGGVESRLLGFRLQAVYRWEKLSAQDFTNLTTIANGLDIKLKFPAYPQRYPVRVSAWRHGLADGLSDADAAEMTFTGLYRVKAYPNADLLYTMPPWFDDAIMIIALEEQ
ncbi:MAG: hypothetical protein D6800_11030 [Candidatus Zixiibacteriota bacterium]|nr:MAG: hypothetical protein D6800_11030 [candidate division Zixibacteria bacterium]